MGNNTMNWLKKKMLYLLNSLLIASIFILLIIPVFSKENIDINNPNNLNNHTNAKLYYTLTENEIKWLKNNPTITVSNELNYPPFDFAIGGEAQGYSIELLNLLLRDLKIEIKYVNGYTWSELVEMFKEGKIDLLHSLYKTPEREKIGIFSDYYKRSRLHFVTKLRNPEIKNMSELKGKTIAVGKGWMQEEFIRKNYPEIKILTYNNISEILDAVEFGKAYAAFNNIDVLKYFINKKKLNHLKISEWVEELDSQSVVNYHFLGQKNSPELISILNKAIGNISIDELNNLNKKWFGAEIYINNNLNLTSEELRWLQGHQKIRVHNEEEWAPYNFKKNGKAKGYSIDFMNIIGKKLGLKIEYVSGENWNEFLDLSKKKEIDVILNVGKNGERDEYLSFTSPYLSMSPRIVHRKSRKTYKSFKDLDGKKIAAVEGFNSTYFLMQQFPDYEIAIFPGTLTAVLSIINGDTDAMIGDYAVINYIIKENSLSHLTISPPIILEEEVDLNLYIGVRKDWQILTKILNKAIENLSSQDYFELQYRWLTSYEELPLNEISQGSYFISIIGAIMILFFTFIGLFFLYRTFSNEQLLKNFKNKNFRILTALGTSIMIFLVTILVFSTLDRNKEITMKSIENELKIIIKTTNENNDLWMQEHLNLLNQLGRDIELIAIAKRLLRVPTDAASLRNSIELKEAREFIAARENELGQIGFFIINPDNISIASRRDTNLGTENLISQQKPRLLKQAFQGKAVFIPPIHSDVDIYTDVMFEDEDYSKRPLTMFFTAPIRDSNGKVIAVIAQRLIPNEQLSRNMLVGQIGASGETYLINSQGQIVTNSRFLYQLKNLELLDYNKEFNQTIEVRDPGVNLLNGNNPLLPRSEQPFTKISQKLLKLAEDMKDSKLWVDHREFIVDMSAYRDYRGVPVFGVGFWEKHLEMGMITEIDVAEALSGYYTLRFSILLITSTTLLLLIMGISISVILGEKTTTVLLENKKELEKRVEKRTIELKDAQEHFSKVLEAAPDGILVIDDKGFITLVNAQAENLFGLSKSKLIGSRIDELIIYENIEFGNDLILQHSSGRNIPIDINLSPLNTAKGTITIAVIRDISVRKESEKELRKLSRAVEESPVVIMITDKDGTIEYVNHYFSSVSGYSREEAIGKNPRIVKSGHHSNEYYEKLWTTILSGKEWKGDFENRKKNGELYWESVSISPIFDSKGDILNFIGIKRDITERKIMEEELIKAKEEAEVATKAKSDFLANMSHEIRTPMNAILGMSHLALKTDLSPKQNDYIQKIDNSAQSLLGIINDILDFSKIEAGKLNIEIIDFNLNVVMTNLTNLMFNKIQEKRLEFILDIHHDTPLHLQGDPLRLGQILLNLVNNAVKFTEKGEIVVKVSTLSQIDNEVELQFSVRDTGIGLSEIQKNKLFQSFEQADVSTTRKYGGTGLGLAICKNLVEMMNGSIHVESKRDIGSNFIFTAKFTISRNKEEKKLETPKSLENLKIMVIDDNYTFRQLMKVYLKNFGFSVLTVDSGINAINVLENTINEKQRLFDLIFIDWQMNGIDGIETFNRINKINTYDPKPKTILMSGFNPEQAEGLTKLFGFGSFLSKPISESRLYDSIMEIFGFEVTNKMRQDRRIINKPDGFENIRGANILLVEDNPVNQQVATELLEAEGFYVDIADNGQVAIDILENRNTEEMYDLVLMDLQMPIMDGYTATQSLRNDDRFKELAIIAMTADAMSGVKEKVAKTGMNDYVTKPINPPALFKTLVNWIKAGERTLPSEYIENLKKNNYEEEPIILPGFDTKHAVLRVGGKVSTYKKTLQKVLENERDAVERLKDSLNSGEHETALRIAHTIKGVAGNIGAVSLQLVALELETSLSKNITQIPQELVEPFIKIFNESISIIDEALKSNISKLNKNENSHSGESEIDLVTVEKLTSSLAEKIENFDSSATETIEEIILKIKGTSFETIASELAKALENYDFDTAEELLQKLINEIKEAL